MNKQVESDGEFWEGWESGKDVPQEVDKALPHYAVGSTVETWFPQDGKFHMLTIVSTEKDTKFFLDGVVAEIVQKSRFKLRKSCK